MKKQAGFTLIELVIVIVILGILAATAVPKFINLQGDARAATLKGVKTALEGAANLTYSRAAIKGWEKDNAAANREIDGVKLVYGYPAANKASIKASTELPDSDWIIDETTVSGKVIVYPMSFSGAASTIIKQDTGGCNVLYEASASSTARPTITVYGGGC